MFSDFSVFIPNLFYEITKFAELMPSKNVFHHTALGFVYLLLFPGREPFPDDESADCYSTIWGVGGSWHECWSRSCFLFLFLTGPVSSTIWPPKHGLFQWDCASLGGISSPSLTIALEGMSRQWITRDKLTNDVKNRYGFGLAQSTKGNLAGSEPYG